MSGSTAGRVLPQRRRRVSVSRQPSTADESGRSAPRREQDACCSQRRRSAWESAGEPAITGVIEARPARPGYSRPLRALRMRRRGPHDERGCRDRPAHRVRRADVHRPWTRTWRKRRAARPPGGRRAPGHHHRRSACSPRTFRPTKWPAARALKWMYRLVAEASPPLNSETPLCRTA